jgi:hypothetical protein
MAAGVSGPVHAAVSRPPQTMGQTKVALSPAHADATLHITISIDGTRRALEAEGVEFIEENGGGPGTWVPILGFVGLGLMFFRHTGNCVATCFTAWGQMTNVS